MEARPVALSSHLTPAVIASFVVRHYGLAVSEFSRELVSYSESMVWQFVAANQAWFIKLYSPLRSSLADVVDEAMLYQHLAERGVNAPLVHRTLADDLAQELRVGELAYPAMIMKSETLRTARPSHISRNEMFTIVHALARLHVAVRDYPFLDRLPGRIHGHPVRAAFARSAHQLKQWGRRLAKRSCAGSNDNMAPDAAQADLHARLHKGVAALRAQFEAHARHAGGVPNGLAKTLIHGDMALHHAPFLPNQEVYFYDFADRSWAAVIEELVILAAHLYTVEDIGFARWEELMDWMFEGYTAQSVLDAKDYAAFKPILIHRLLDELSYLWGLSTARRLPWPEIARRHRLARYLLRGARGRDR